jgi:hypothetical protein
MDMRRAGRFGSVIIVGLLVAAAIGAGVAYRAMVAVKPRVVRPVLDEATRADVDALRASLMRHVGILAGEIGERSLLWPESLRAAADYISGVWSSQGFSHA